MPPSTAGASANSLRVEYTGPDRPVIETLTITSDHSPLDNSGRASLRTGTIRTFQPSESSTCRSADWLTTSSSIIRIPTLATSGPLTTTEYSPWPGTPGRWPASASRTVNVWDSQMQATGQGCQATGYTKSEIVLDIANKKRNTPLVLREAGDGD